MQLRRRLPYPRLYKAALLLFLIWNIVEVELIYLRVSRPTWKPPTKSHPRIFIASLHWNNEGILRSHWNQAVLDLASAIGPDNVFVSVLEGGSWDDSAGALRELDSGLGKLGVQRDIVLENKTHAEIISVVPSVEIDGWIRTPRGRIEFRRIPYLAALRNRALDPLRRLARRGIIFDRVLFLEDVVFTVGT